MEKTNNVWPLTGFRISTASASKAKHRARRGEIGSLARRREFRRLADQAADVDRRLDAARTRRREAERLLSSFSGQVNVQIEAHLRAAEPITHDAAARLRIAFSAAEKQFRHAWDAQQESDKQGRAVEGQIEHAQRQPQPTAADFDAAARAEEQERAGTLARLPELEIQATHVRGEIERLEKRDTELVSRLIQESPDYPRRDCPPGPGRRDDLGHAARHAGTERA